MTDSKTFPILSATKPAAVADPLEPLRLESASALERGLGFIDACGDEFARTCALVTLEARSTEAGLALLEARQREDGSFDVLGCVLPGARSEAMLRAGFDASLIGALEALSLLADWRLLFTPCAERVVAYLDAAQLDDGAWGPREEGEEEPLWRVFLAGMLSGFFARTRSARPRLLSTSMRYLAESWSVERIRRDGWPLVAAYAHHFAGSVDENRDVALPWCGRELERGFAAGEYSGRDTTRALLYCDAATLPGANFDVATLIGSILSEQAQDGGWAPEEAQARGRIGPTLDAMAGLIKLCRVAPID